MDPTPLCLLRRLRHARTAKCFLPALFLLGFGLLGYSALLGPYRNEGEFQQRYAQMTVGNSAEFGRLRKEMLTPKYAMHDYGVTCLLLCCATWFWTRERSFVAPRATITYVAVAIAAPCSLAAAYVFDLVQSSSRGEFPHWADSLGIPLLAVPPLLFFGLVWSLLHLIMLRGVHPRNRKAKGAECQRCQ